MLIARKSRFVVPNDEILILPFSDPPRYLPGVFFRTRQIKGTPLLQLVEAYRNTEGQPRQRVVASLGNATLPAGDPRRLAKAVEEQINGQTGLLGLAVPADCPRVFRC